MFLDQRGLPVQVHTSQTEGAAHPVVVVGSGLGEACLFSAAGLGLGCRGYDALCDATVPTESAAGVNNIGIQDPSSN